MVFDEVDAGIGGEAALAVGRSLAALGEDRQVFVVTHLPQVAAFADHQLRVAKQVDGTVTVTVKLQMWLDQVAFDDVPQSGDGKPVVLGAGLARNQLVRGAQGGLAYVFTFAPR